MRLSHLPLRLTAGAYLVHAGLSRGGVVPEAPWAPGGDRALGAGELALGAVLLSPFVPPLLAGTALTAFTGIVLRNWWRAPGTHEPGSLRPTPLGRAATKDLLLLGTGVTLLTDALTDGARRTARATARAAHLGGGS